MGVYRLKNFSKIKGVVHGFSTKDYGDMSFKNRENNKNFRLFLEEVGVSKKKLIGMEQAHKANVEWVLESSISEIPKTDALISNDQNVAIFTVTADCLPLLFYDKKRKVVAIAHAGWKGVLNKIAVNVINKMLETGSKVNDIFVGIGPSIRSCCYNVDKERLDQFWVKNSNFLDLQDLVCDQLFKNGTPLENVEDSNICTACSSDFYSFRKQNNKDKFKQFLSVISLV